jgi:EAL domain-containing protein (putative c-di-GMP-specific phosphodiesterase class I)
MVVAEGIEAPEEEEVLLELGVHFGQGYLFGKPRPLQWKSKVLSDD